MRTFFKEKTRQRKKVEIRDLGIVGYEDALGLQADILRRRIEGKVPDTLIMVEHDPVITLGRLAGEDGIIDRKFFEDRGIPVVSSRRGGKITYHARGQLVLYPVVDLGEKKRDVAFYIDFLEETVSRSLRRLGVPAEREGKRRGVWVKRKKIAFIGIAVRRWVAFHGAAVNINNDIAPFSRIYPCGENDIRVTSVKRCLGRGIDMNAAKRIFAEQFEKDLNAVYGRVGSDGIKTERSS